MILCFLFEDFVVEKKICSWKMLIVQIFFLYLLFLWILFNVSESICEVFVLEKIKRQLVLVLGKFLSAITHLWFISMRIEIFKIVLIRRNLISFYFVSLFFNSFFFITWLPLQPNLDDDLSNFSPFVPYKSVDKGHWELKIDKNGPKRPFFAVSDFFSN